MKASDSTSRTRLPHAVLDRATRIQKAQKIVSVLGKNRFASARRILEVGCGSGVIAHTLNELGKNRIRVFGVDVVDNRIETDGFEFSLVSGTSLPYDEGSFDIVITNHVIEHVGDQAAQRHHLREISRVLTSDGVAYLAVPNRWRLIEPHYRLPLLSWLPHPMSDWYLGITGRGRHYDCEPLSHRQALELFAGEGFSVIDKTIPALRATLAIESPTILSKAANRYLPDWLLSMPMWIMPTYIFLLSPHSPELRPDAKL